MKDVRPLVCVGASAAPVRVVQSESREGFRDSANNKNLLPDIQPIRKGHNNHSENVTLFKANHREIHRCFKDIVQGL